LILLLAVLVGIGAGLLTTVAGENWAQAVLIGSGAAGGGAVLFNTLIGPV
jgi:hypothetical protein